MWVSFPFKIKQRNLHSWRTETGKRDIWMVVPGSTKQTAQLGQGLHFSGQNTPVHDMVRKRIWRARGHRQETIGVKMGKKECLAKSYGFVHKLRFAPFVNKPTAAEHWPFTSSQQAANLRTALLVKKNINPLSLRKNAKL